LSSSIRRGIARRASVQARCACVGGERRIERREIGRRADVGPRPVVAFARDVPEANPFAVERQHFQPDAARKLAKQRRVVDADVAERQPLACIRFDALADECEVAARVVRRVRDHHEVHARRLRSAGFAQRVESGTKRRVIEPRPDVAGNDQRGTRRKQRRRRRNAAGSLERLRLARPCDAHAERIPGAECGNESFRAMRRVDRDVAESRLRERFDLPGDQRPAADAQQRLRQRVGQRPHALAAACGEDHRARELRHAGSGKPETRERSSSASSNAASGSNSG
jgi:hypothetical protein